jgi:hypothetical protein
LRHAANLDGWVADPNARSGMAAFESWADALDSGDALP